MAVTPQISMPRTIFAEDACPICLEPYESEGNDCFALHCGHVFHVICIEKLDQESRNQHLTCPLCRQEAALPGIEINPIQQGIQQAAQKMESWFFLNASLIVGQVIQYALREGVQLMTHGRSSQQSRHITHHEVEINQEGLFHPYYLIAYAIVTLIAMGITSAFYIKRASDQKRDVKAHLINYIPVPEKKEGP